MPERVSTSRVNSIDIIRGAIMIVMALDHVREYFYITALSADPTDPATTTPILFFTRWITHYCAPSFLLLSGISAYLSGRKKTLSESSSFLAKRGLWLIFVELVIITFALTFDITYKFFILQVIWAVGMSMLVLSVLIRIVPTRVILYIGLILIFGHNLLGLVKLPENSVPDIVLNVFFTAAGKFYPIYANHGVLVLYVILPWTGLMLVGYGLGSLYDKEADPAQRKRMLLILGSVATALFVILRLINGYGDQAPWSSQSASWRTFLSFLNVSKYPPSLMYCLMTQGPVLLLLAVTEQVDNRISRFLSVYGKVPFFYYIIHFYLIHGLCALAVLASGYTWRQATNPEMFFQFRPDNFGFSLEYVYLIWIGIIILLYMPCRWFGKYKTKRKKKWWLSYL
ncbi:hypothetical protein DSL64_04825 [Dyadobacter luteus]|uniref:Heparan-alpha-glucosaminide N-acetyltransferase catalytic domain-containing protein n=1 Tax=Dyadobacter luteus TaxID=2259619 RepID=A0A3D8YGF0_9BACT|nr:heparan-alpha-glucosaminide N-acetyltransferase domain-containing protein [Dyadobacter luteus]REA63755.1 hypothetical protein DSL64_04825 [Dyadobacter luteus]